MLDWIATGLVTRVVLEPSFTIHVSDPNDKVETQLLVEIENVIDAPAARVNDDGLTEVTHPLPGRSELESSDALTLPDATLVTVLLTVYPDFSTIDGILMLW